MNFRSGRVNGIEVSVLGPADVRKSKSVLARCPRHVRFHPDGDQIVDITFYVGDGP
jgi:hypothetical protein